MSNNSIGQSIGDTVKGVLNTGHGIGEAIRGTFNDTVDQAGEGLRNSSHEQKKQNPESDVAANEPTASHPYDEAKNAENKSTANQGLEEIKQGWEQVTGQNRS